jgi:hypothetical protein
MALPLDKLGTTYGPTATVVDLERVRACAAATAVSSGTDVVTSAPEVGPVDGATHAFGAISQGAVVAEHGPAEVV